MPKCTGQLAKKNPTPVGPKTVTFLHTASVKHCQGNLNFWVAKWALCTVLRSDITEAERNAIAPYKCTACPPSEMYSERCRTFENKGSPQVLGIKLVCLLFDIFFSFFSPSCRWGRSGPRQEQVRCAGLWHSAEGGPEVHAPLTTQCPWLASLSKLQQHPSDYTALPSDRPLSTSMQGNLAKCLHFYHWNKVMIKDLVFFCLFVF